MVERPAAGTVPDAPGSYQFRDAEGRVLYVGKAKSLRNRLGSYFGRRETMANRTAQMLDEATTVEWIQVANELEALMLEFNLIQEHRPRFNVDLKDDKSYPFLAVTVGDEWPRPMVTRGKRRRGVKYFGPYGHAGAIRETLDLLLRTFPARTCTDSKFATHQRMGKPCLLFHIEKCSGPCVGEVTREDYDGIVKALLRFLDGDTDEVVDRLKREMAEASADLEFEAAARLRDRLASVQKVLEKQTMVAGRDEDLDVIGLAGDDLEAAAQVFYVRRGRVVGRKGFVVDRADDLDSGQLVAEVVAAHYRSDPPRGIPREVLVPHEPEGGALLAEWLAAERGTPVSIRVPKRGDRRSLLETVTRNAEEEFVRHRLKRAADHNTRARALSELQEALGLPEAPLRIECYDMSHLQGTDYVGSMVVMEDGLPRTSEYRRFKIRQVDGNDDYAAMAEVLTRRLTAFLEEQALPVEERPGRFSYPPQLLLVDGGKGQLGVAERVVAELGLADRIPVASLAKQLEEVFRPGSSEPVKLERGSEGLYLLQRIRDESHRFAIDYHRRLRSKRMTGSVLDGIPGLGPTRRKRLVAAFGGVRAVQRAPLEDLVALSWLPDAVGEAVFAKAHRPG
ncbi:MAG TPA: excinuclease ABC subunit UvrC [Acidimicrobiia bacterium]|jgi:excinuclease ABC subunit C|nr:excinuclease ABC subunit UvrC [Acidimicrobiales bacterium]HIE66767.1 excinuclease ABC subunit UvrC [Acidimicrobiia bacterium]HIL49094.1 excinuclease ABC subunit UvrC [Acidimicrobiia bacterium]|tara:strand:- start:5254 stop:7116 length:1863 start_codon:yes stop_codon:yes gene_type:complete